MNSLCEICGIDVGDKTESQGSMAVIPECFVSHDWSQIGTADAHIDYVSDGLSRVALPLATSDLDGELSHAIEYDVNFGHDVLAVDDDGCASRRPQSDMQNCPLVRDIDLLATEHRIDSVLKAAFLGQLNKEPHRLVGYAIL